MRALFLALYLTICIYCFQRIILSNTLLDYFNRASILVLVQALVLLWIIERLICSNWSFRMKMIAIITSSGGFFRGVGLMTAASRMKWLFGAYGALYFLSYVVLFPQENPDLWKWLSGQEQPPEAVKMNPVRDFSLVLGFFHLARDLFSWFFFPLCLLLPRYSALYMKR